MASPFASFGKAAPGRPSAGMPMPGMRQPQQPGITMPQLQNMYQSIFKSKNPMQAIQQMAANNPRFAQISNLMKQGRNPESIFREMAAQRGIDPDDFIRQLQGNNGQK